MRMQFLVTLKKDVSMMFTEKKEPIPLGKGRITETLRPIFPLRTFLICFLEVAFQLVSSLNITLCSVIIAQPVLEISLLSVLYSNFALLGNVHVYSNGRMRFAHHQRHERREQQREVRVTCIVFDLCPSQSLHDKADIYKVLRALY